MQKNRDKISKYKAIIFDMDGTIVDSEKSWVDATLRLLQVRNIYLSPTEAEKVLRKTRGFALEGSCRILVERFDLKDDLYALMEEKAAYNKEFAKSEDAISFIPGFEDFYEKQVRHKFVSGIATNADDSTVTFMDNRLDLRRFFGEHIYGISSVNNVYKPKPDLYLHAAKKLGCDPSECVAIEDSKYGIQAAKKAGMFCIGINSSGNPEDVCEADFVISKYEELDLEKLIGNGQ